MKKFRYSLVAVLAGVALVGAACSDDDSDSEETTTTEAEATTTTESEDSSSEDVSGETIVDIAAGNDAGPIGSAASSSSPWANIQF